MVGQKMEGEVRIYAHDEVREMLKSMMGMLLGEPIAGLLGTSINLVELKDKKPLTAIGHALVPFGIHSTKAKRFGFRFELSSDRWLTCCGDKPLPEAIRGPAHGSEWLLHEAFFQKGEISQSRLRCIENRRAPRRQKPRVSTTPQTTGLRAAPHAIALKVPRCSTKSLRVKRS